MTLLADAAFTWGGLPENISTYGESIDRLSYVLHIFMYILFFGWGAFMAYCLFAFRARSGHKAKYELVKGTVSKYLEVAIAIFEVILLVFLSMPVWARFKNEFPKNEEATNIRIVAQQFAWNFHYPGRDGQFGKVGVNFISNSNPLGIDPDDEHGKDDIVTVNTLRFPVNKPVVARLTAKDVIHSFGVPALRLKQDAIPGMEIPIWFQATKTRGKDEAGNALGWDIACSQLCGNSHYRMRAVLMPLEEPEFQKWLDDQHAEMFPEPTPAATATPTETP